MARRSRAVSQTPSIIEDMEAKDEIARLEEEQLQMAVQQSLLSARQHQRKDQASSSASRNNVSKPLNTQSAQKQSGIPENGQASQRNLDTIERELRDAKAQRAELDALIRALEGEKEEILRQMRSAQTRHSDIVKGKGVAGRINYTEEFDWTPALRAKMKAVFGFDRFRLCQEGICNASMDGRDIVGIMPTGGGKSLGYQLPALMVSGCTLVVSPLLSLITDQILHLREAGVDAVMLTGATSKEESERIYQRLQEMASGVANAPEIKLCYVTPEKIAKSNRLVSTLEKLYNANKLARFVIDEAHCVSQQGHDFRPDYQRLHRLRQLFPEVPILALSATCPPAVLGDLLKTLKMEGPVSGTAAKVTGTVLFTAPLYRKNLHYSVVSKPASAHASILAMRDYILAHHPNDTGIIYCLSKKNAEQVAKTLEEESDRRILTGVYHADIPDGVKEALHRRWRNGQVKVVCATIAFGLGIDKGDVRFVLHHTLSKSLDGYYQESGRAGRDGKDADCVLYYRPQDATRISSLTCGEHNSQEHVLAMLDFASDLEECRKIQFARYFSKSSHLSLNSWSTADEDALTRCGHCDNCTRPPEHVDRRDARVPAWQLLRIVAAAARGKQQLTIAQLCKLARGLRVAGAGDSAEGDGAKGRGRGRGRGRRAAQEKESVDVQEVAGGKVELSEEQTEALCVRLLVEGFLKMSFSPTAYSVNVYMQPADKAALFTRFTREQIEQGQGPAFKCLFLTKASKRKSTAVSAKKDEKTASSAKGKKVAARAAQPASGSSGSRRKRKRDLSESPGEDLGDDDDDIEERGQSAYDDESLQDFVVRDSEVGSGSDADWEEHDMDWSTTLREGKRAAAARPAAKRPRQSRAPAASSSSRGGPWGEVIELSSD
ncbi:P-loop containing nucleoside triphosphate hydrolase protein [Trametes polyzona]|nr:P-loop containing nucleoside triphosphate hydrolase protein [Trametes polyzona]